MWTEMVAGKMATEKGTQKMGIENGDLIYISDFLWLTRWEITHPGEIKAFLNL
jgi:hypothetical protein